MEKDLKTEKARQEDSALNRALLWVAGAIILEVLLVLIDRYYINFYTDEQSVALALGIGTAVRVGCVLFLMVCVAGAVWTWLRRKKGEGLMLPWGITLAGFALFFFFALIWHFNSDGVALLYVLIPAAAVLALVYYLYQRECFLAVALTALGLLGIWLVRKGSYGPYATLIDVYLVGMAVVSVLALIALALLQKRGGVLSWKGGSVRVLHKKTNYPLLYVTCVLMLAAFVAALVLSPALMYYLIFALIAWAFILVVYHTVQML